MVGQTADGELVLRHSVTLDECLDAQRTSTGSPLGALVDKDLVGERVLFCTVTESIFFGATKTTSDGDFLAFGNLKRGIESDDIPSFGETF